MSSHIRRFIHNTRARVLSTDANDEAALHHRALIETASALASPSTARSGVLRGLQVSVLPGTLSVVVSPGLAFRVGTPPSSFDSASFWLEIRNAVTVDLTALVNGSNPRWVMIEVSEADATETATLADIFVPSSGTFTSQSVNRIRGSAPVIHANAGTPAPQPVLPAGVAGRIPLCAVYIAAAAATLVSGDTVSCRPILVPTRGLSIDGGGVSVPAAGSNVNVHPIEIVGSDYPGGRMRVSALSGNLNLDTASHPMWRSGQSYFFGATTAVYLYACPAPYPSGYDAALAPREFVPGSNIGPGNRIPSVPAAVAGVVENCIIVASVTPPPSNDSLVGDAIQAGVNDTFWNGGTFPRSVYLGSCTYSAGAGTLIRQSLIGNGEVMWRPAAQSHLPDESDTRNNASSGVLTGNWSLENPFSATGNAVTPTTAIAALARVIHNTTLSTSWQWSISEPTPSIGSVLQDSGGTDSAHTRNELAWLLRDPSAGTTFTWQHQEGSSNNSTLTMTTKGYRDAILAAR